MDEDMVFNRDVKRRDGILKEFFDKGNAYGRFRGLTTEVMQQLIDEKFLDPEDNQNGSPTAGDFLDFMKEYPFVKAHGYAIGIDRIDYRITIERLEADLPEDKDTKIEFIIDFVNRFHHADSLTLTENSAYAWWD